MANIMPTSFKKDLGTAKIDWLNDTFKMMLLTSSASPSASWAHRSDVTNEVTGTGYTAGGAALASETVTAATTTQVFKCIRPMDYRHDYRPVCRDLQSQGRGIFGG
jgi:hypothetical protein